MFRNVVVVRLQDQMIVKVFVLMAERRGEIFGVVSLIIVEKRKKTVFLTLWLKKNTENTDRLIL